MLISLGNGIRQIEIFWDGRTICRLVWTIKNVWVSHTSWTAVDTASTYLAEYWMDFGLQNGKRVPTWSCLQKRKCGGKCFGSCIGFAISANCMELFCRVLAFWPFLRKYSRFRHIAGTFGVHVLHKLSGGGTRRFTYADLKTATNNFSDELERGRFGTVYKGVLPDQIRMQWRSLKRYFHIIYQ